jgi:ribosome biogenesis protein ENP2
VPEIGPAPKWASFLDSVTEELADDVQGGAGKGAYSDYKFVDRQELDTYVHPYFLKIDTDNPRLGLTHLIGTPTLKPYMHGYFLSLKLYSTARLIANPQSYAEHRDRVVSDRLAAKAESRIRAKKEQPKVNKGLAERLRRAEEREEAMEKKRKERRGEGEDGEEEVEEEREKGEKAKGRETLLSDPRFKDLWENPDFEVDEDSREFAMLNPATANNNVSRSCAQVVSACMFGSYVYADPAGPAENGSRGGRGRERQGVVGWAWGERGRRVCVQRERRVGRRR